MKRHPTTEAKQTAAKDLARTGRWVGVIVFSARMDWGRAKALAVLQSLMADGLVEMQDVPSKVRGVRAERMYRLKAGTDVQSVTGSTKTAPKRRGERNEELVHALVIERGTMTSSEVAEAVSLPQPTARGVLARLEAAGRLCRFLGPQSETGSQRPWYYQAPVT